jgi:hypothetical protein
MSGSLRFFKYEDDRGNEWALRADESNTEGVQGAQIPVDTAIASLDILPKNIKPRYARLVDSSGRTSKNVVVLSPTRFGAIAADFTLDVDSPTGSNTPITLNLRELVGERRTSPVVTDTALNDGD